MSKKKKNKRHIGPVFTLILLIAIIILMSSFLSIIGFEGSQASINNGAIETSIVTVKNVLSKEGIRFLIGNITTNFTLFEPLVILIISLIGIGIGEKSGLFKAAFTPFKKWKPSHITMLTLLVGMISTFVGESSYAFLIPLAGIFYKYASKNSRLGIITMFLGIGIGYGTGLFTNYTDYLLGSATQLAATLEVDKTYQFSMLSNFYIMLGSTLILTIVGTIIIEKMIAPRYAKKTPTLDEEVVISKRGLAFSSVVAVLFLMIVGYGIIPKLPGSGFLLDMTETHYIAQLLGTNAPFGQSFTFLFVVLLMVCSLVYGYVSKNIKSSNDYSLGLSKSFEGTGYAFVLMFFASQMIAILEWTNLGTVLSARLVSFLSSVQFSGIPLIVTFFLIVILMSLIIPSTEAKWTLLSPLIIPLFMRSNITPDFTQFIFKAADGVGKCMTPMFGYFIVFLAFLQKYNYDENNEITIFGLLKKILPVVFVFAGLWILILIGWYVIGLPIGIGSYTTL